MRHISATWVIIGILLTLSTPATSNVECTRSSTLPDRPFICTGIAAEGDSNTSVGVLSFSIPTVVPTMELDINSFTWVGGPEDLTRFQIYSVKIIPDKGSTTYSFDILDSCKPTMFRPYELHASVYVGRSRMTPSHQRRSVDMPQCSFNRP